MTKRNSRPEDPAVILEEAQKLAGAERDAYLEHACGGSAEFRATIESMIAARAEQGDFLAEPTVTTDGHEVVAPGMSIGHYKVREAIGEGGMGVVFVAEQEQPVRRRVALKIIKPGMDTAEVIARFEAERQALAMMDHPNIAKVLDAGSTGSGRPYFVMELVRGIPAIEYCDKKKLSVRERLELFVTICQAVQHAHQKGVIHRDIKPSNVLVADHDGKPVPKVIDFGVAKATNQRLTERTIYTRFTQIIGTPMYMSPEQAQFSGLDVDTRSDIYSLGVLLYELLTGTTPFQMQRLQEAAYDEILRIIREEEPVKPSVKISTLGENATLVSIQRNTDPKRLTQTVRGDLDWIVLTAMEKDRTRRYDTAAGLASDVQRYLRDDAIAARPPSLVYQMVKFARRNRTATITTVLVLASLVLGVVSTAWMRTVAKREAQRANQTLKSLTETLYDKAVLDVLMNNQEMAEETLHLLQDEESMSSRALVLQGLMGLNRGEYDVARRCAELAVNQDRDSTGAAALLTVAYIWAGYDDRGEHEMHRLRGMQCRSDADQLLMALALLHSDPQEAQRLLDMTPAAKHSPVGLMISALADSPVLTTTNRHDGAAAEKAVRDFEYVQFFFRNTPASLSHRVFSLAIAARLARSEGRTDDMDRYVEEGQRPARKLMTKADNYPAGAWSCQNYYRAAGDREQAWFAIRKVGRHSGTYSWFLAAACLERFGADAIREFDNEVIPAHRDINYVRLARAYLLGCLPERRHEVKALVEDMLDDPSPFLRRHALLAMWSVWSAEQIRDRAAPTSISGLWYDAECLKHMAREFDEPQLFEQAGDNANRRLSAHFTLAMMCLADGKREDAQRHFQACLATDALGWFDFEWSLGYLTLIDADRSRFESRPDPID